MTITIFSPKAHHIYQRNVSNRADIPIAGEYTGSPAAIEASFNGGIWTVIDDNPSGGAFNAVLEGQATGQGTLTVRFTDAPATLDTVDPISIGDIYLIMGQSNAAGNGNINHVVTGPLTASMWKREETTVWRELADPMWPTGAAAGSPWPFVATNIMGETSIPFGLIMTAEGGAGLTNGEWQKGGVNYDACLAAITASGVNDIKAMLWHQGEQDVSEGASQSAYQTAMSAMVDDLQADSPLLAGKKLVVAQLGDRGVEPRENVDAIRLAQQGAWMNDPDILAGPILYDINLNPGDGTHFGAGPNAVADMHTLADRWWRMLRHYFYGGTLEYAEGRAPRIASVTRAGAVVTVTFSGGVAPLTGQTDTTGWRFTDDGAPVGIVSAAGAGSNQVVVTLASAPLGIGLISFGSNEDAHGTLLLDSGTIPLPPEPFVDQPTTGAASVEPDFSGVYAPDFAFYVDVENAEGTKLGSGPLRVISFTYTARFDRAGTISFAYLASDAQAQHVTNRRYARAWALLNGVYTEVGYGRIDNVQTVPELSGRVVMTASGLDVITELGDRNVGNLEIGKATEDEVPVAGATHTQALATIGGLAPDGWVFIPDATPPNDYLYARFGGESVLGALIHLAQRTRSHFYRSTGKELVFISTFAASGVRAIDAASELGAQICGITRISRTVDTHDYLSRITPFGSGTGEARLTLRACNRTAPDGYTLNKALNYLENDGATTTHGYKDHPQIEFKEITPISNTDADLVAASNMLFDAAFAELERRSSLADQYTYDLEVMGCSVLLHPLQTLRVRYWDPDQNIDIDEDLLILEATWTVDTSGVHTTSLVVSTDARWPDSDIQAAAERATQGRVFVAHPQMGPNALALSYSKPVDSDEVANFRFHLGKEIVTLQQVVFHFELLPLESTVKSVGGASSGSGELDTTVPSINTSGNPSNDTSGTPSTNTSGVPSTDVSGTATGNTGNASGDTGTATGNTGTATGDTGGSGTLTTDEPEGGDVISAGQHWHWIEMSNDTTPDRNVGITIAGSQAFLTYDGANAGTLDLFAIQNGDHVHDIGTHIHTLNSHDHSLNSHVHDLNGHAHTLNSHFHDLNNHAHSLNSHSHDLGGHTHTLNSHTHTLSLHTHSLSNHIHDLSEAITAFYGIFRETVQRTYTIDQLEYSVNSGSWLHLDEAEDIGGGWYSLDITEFVINDATFRPLQANNHLSIRAGVSQLDIANWDDHDTYTRFETNAPHGFVEDQWVEIDGADLGAVGNSSVDGVWQVVLVEDSVRFRVSGPVVTPNLDFGVGGGIARAYGTAMIDGQLTIRSTIQAIAVTA